MITPDHLGPRCLRLHGLARALGVEIEAVVKAPGLLTLEEAEAYLDSLRAAAESFGAAANVLAVATFRLAADQAERERRRQ